MNRAGIRIAKYYSIDGEHILISGQSPVGHSLCQLVEAPIDGQWLPILHPGDSGGRRTSGDAGQGRGCESMGEPQVCDVRKSWEGTIYPL